MALLLLALFACGPREVTLHGRVLEDRAEGSDPLVGGTVAVRDDVGDLYDEVVTDASGHFSALAPAGRTIHAVVDGDGLVPASFTGSSGVRPEFEVPDGQLAGFSVAELEEWEARFDGCPGAGEGGVLVGRLRYFLFADDPDDEPPPVETPTVTLFGFDGSEVEACYLDDEGAAYAPDAEHAGPAGIFAAFGLEEGVYVVVIRHGVASQGFTEQESVVWVPGAGVAPRFPLYVEFPLIH